MAEETISVKSFGWNRSDMDNALRLHRLADIFGDEWLTHFAKLVVDQNRVESAAPAPSVSCSTRPPRNPRAWDVSPFPDLGSASPSITVNRRSFARRRRAH